MFLEGEWGEDLPPVDLEGRLDLGSIGAMLGVDVRGGHKEFGGYAHVGVKNQTGTLVYQLNLLVHGGIKKTCFTEGSSLILEEAVITIQVIVLI